MSLRKKLVIVVPVVAMFGVVPASQAQVCKSDADCQKGMLCNMSAGAVAPDIACAKDSTECPAPPQSNPTYYCQLAPCQGSADCGQNMVCNKVTSTVCTGTAQAPVKCDPAGTKCEPPPPSPPPVCTEVTTATCAFKWDLPCNADADCGAGFVCRPSVTGSCAGSGGGGAVGTSDGASVGSGAATGSSSGTAALLPPRPPVASDAGAPTATICTVSSSFPGYCQVVPVFCDADSDCQPGWVCDASGMTTGDGVAVGGGTTGTGAVAGTGTATSGPTGKGGVAGTGTVTPTGGSAGSTGINPIVAKDAGAAPAPKPAPQPAPEPQPAPAPPSSGDNVTSVPPATKTCRPYHAYVVPTDPSISVGGAEGQGGTRGSYDGSQSTSSPTNSSKSGTTNAQPTPAPSTGTPPTSSSGPTGSPAAATTNSGGCAVGAGSLAGDTPLLFLLFVGLALALGRRRSR